MKESEEDMDEVQLEKLKRSPVKALARLRVLNPAYRDVIDSRWFAKEHHRRMEDRLLLRHHFWDRSFNRKTIYALCDDDLATYDVPAELQIPDNPNVWSMVGVSKGVLCMASAELGRVVLLNPATRQAALLPPFSPLFGSNKPVATKFGFGLHDEEEGVFRVLVIGYHHENGGNSYCRILFCTNSGVGGEWRWDEVRGIPPLLSGGTSFSIDSSKSATFLDGVFYWPVLTMANNTTVPVVEYDARRGTFGLSEVRVQYTSEMEVTLAVCDNKLEFILLKWRGDQFLEIYRRGDDATWSKKARINVHFRGLIRPPKRIDSVISYFKPGQLLLDFEDEGVFVFRMNGHAGEWDGRTISLTHHDLKRIKVRRDDLGIGGGSSFSYVYESPQVVVYRESLVGLPGGLPWDPSGDTYFGSR